jgi:L-lactate dehydrogenase (cytochrome)
LQVYEISELKELARRRVPRMFFDYADSGSWTESTYRANEEDIKKIKLRQRVAIDMDNRDLSSMLIGQKVTMPVALAPTGLTGMQYPNGEMVAAKVAEQYGIPFTLSTMSICSIEDVRSATMAPFWFQLYVMRERGFVADLIARAKAAKCGALVLTLDLQMIGQRHKDLRNGLSAPPRLMRPSTLWQLATRPRWCLSMLGTRRYTFRNLVGHVKDAKDLTAIVDWIGHQFDPTLNWDDVAWVKKQWGGKLILKGILDPEDAALAVKSGADAIVVSNHGGRQLDGARSTISALPGIVDKVGGQIEILFDGGVRSGQDVFRALALGARGVLIGRAFLWGLGAGGGKGVKLALDIIRKELDVTMGLCGERSVANIGRHNIVESSLAAL